MKRRAEKAIRESLAKKHDCYVLITCDQSSADGQMEVEMTYQGDATLAAYLLEGAQGIIDEKDLNNESSQSKVHYI